MVYESILKTDMILAARDVSPKGCYLQQDNLPTHGSKNICTFLKSREADIILGLISWPSRSKDFNPVENLWSVLNSNIRKCQPKTLGELEEIILEEWD